MRLGLFSFAILSLTAGSASAQSTAPPPAPPPQIAVSPAPREGLSLGVGLTFGSLLADCSDCGDALSGGVQFHAGWMVRPYLAIVGEDWVMARSDGFVTIYQNLATAGARVWAMRRLWLQGGLGLATAGYRSEGLGPIVESEDLTAHRPGFMIGAGFEAIQRPVFALSLELRYGTGLYSQDVGDEHPVGGHSVGLGATAEWY